MAIGHRVNIRSSSNLRRQVWVCLLLIACIGVVFWQVRYFDFVNFDDNSYVTENSHVQQGITKEGTAWAFSFNDKDRTYWHPLTWLSHMLDVQLYGLDAGRHHVTNVVFHIANALLLFLLLHRMTGALWRSALVAILFALHPINVESVVWIAERKNVLSTFFWMLTSLAYVCYTTRPSLPRYSAVLFIFALGLLAKPMLVTLPFVLLLLDYWPLRRIFFQQPQGAGSHRPALRLVLEKVPFLVLSGLSIYFSSLSAQDMGSVIPLKSVAMGLRIENAVVSYVKYIAKMILPVKLAVFYPYPDAVPLWQFFGALAFLVGISALAIWTFKRHPYVGVGWFWYLGTLIPVIGLVQVGLWPALADRWAYVPLIGLFMMMTWGISGLIKSWQPKQIGFLFVATTLLLMFVTRIQLGHWANSINLFKHAISVTEENALAHNMLAYSLAEAGELDDAVDHLYAGLKIQPHNAGAYNNLANIRLKQNHVAEAIQHFKNALQIEPELESAHYNMANALMVQGKNEEAIQHFEIAVRLDPNNVDVLNNLANALIATGRINDALQHYAAALRLNPNDPEVHNNLGVALLYAGESSAAVLAFKRALRLKPGYTQARKNLSQALKLRQN